MNKLIKAYIFIDTNLLKNLLQSEKHSSTTLPILRELHNSGYKVLIPQQVIDELNRNRFGKWAEKDSNKITVFVKALNTVKSDVMKDLKFAKDFEKSLLAEIERLNNIELSRIDSLISASGHSSKVIDEIKKSFEILPDNPEALKRAENRKLKGK